MSIQGKLELTWVGKYNAKSIEPRILMEDKSKSYGDISTYNMLIHGDNLLALKALENDYSGRVKCVYIDPPYNTGSAFEHYHDGLEHSEWLCMMKPRLELIRDLLTEDGTIWISIDDDERDYLKILCDEVFGRKNFITAIIWQKIHSIKNDARYLSVNHDYILVYAKDINFVKFNMLNRTEDMNNRYKNPDNDPRGPWQSGDLVANEVRTNGNYDLISPTGKVFNVPPGKHWVYSQENMINMINENRIWFGKSGTSFPRKKRFLSEVQQGRTPDTWWTSEEVGHNQEAKREVKALFPDDIFATPKPERLVSRILEIATSEGDLVLDSFLGSGTTAAVAHKMGRKWIGIEQGDHCYSHCQKRLEKVINGEAGGISKNINWQGGGGFKFYELADSLLVKNSKLPIYQINPVYSFEMVAEAICKIEGFKYDPKGEYHGTSSENRYIHITYEFVNSSYIVSLTRSLEKTQSLLIYCTKKQSNINLPDNIEIKRIPKDILAKCDFEREGM